MKIGAEQMDFEFMTSERIVFGIGTIKHIGKIASTLGKQALIVCGSGSVDLNPIIAQLKSFDVNYEVFHVSKEPNVETIEAGLKLSKQNNSEFVIGFGGGSVIDAAKAIAVMMTNSGTLLDYLEIIGQGKPILHKPADVIAVPTTAGTGTEVTKNAVISSPEHKLKVSLRSPMMIPKVALIDPELTISMPQAITASTGMDALTQLIEAFTSKQANPMTDSLIREGVRRASRSLRVAYHEPGNIQAREDMCLASLIGGMALANAGLGAVHGFAAVIGGMFDAPHGEVCACLLPAVVQENIAAIKATNPDSPYLDKYKEIATLLLDDEQANIEDSIKYLVELKKDLKIRNLSDFGIEQTNYSKIVENARMASSMQKNPIVLPEFRLYEILNIS